MAEMTFNEVEQEAGFTNRSAYLATTQARENYLENRSEGAASALAKSGTVGQGNEVSGDTTRFSLYRGAFFYDLAALPDNAVISSVILSLYVISIHTNAFGTDFDVVVVSGRDVGDSVTESDYGRLFGATESFGEIDTADLTEGQYEDISLNATAIAYLSLLGIRKLALRSNRDIGGITSLVHEFVNFSVLPASPTKLIVTYTAASPSVKTDAASSITTTGATLNGTLTDDGGAAKDCGFEWGRTTNYGNTTATESKETAETFSQALTGLLPNTIYHFRALADSTTGADKLFLTLAPIPGDGAAPGPSIVSGLVGTLRHHWEPGRYRLEIGLGGYGRAFSTIGFAHYGAAEREGQPDLTPPVGQEEICAMAVEARTNWWRALAEGRYAEAPALQRIYEQLWAACTSRGTIYAATGVKTSANIEELHRARKPLKDWQPGQTEQAISRLARSPIHQAMVSDVAFTADDHNSISWAAGNIIFSNGVSYAIVAGSLDLTATHYIYYVRGDTALWSSTTFSDAIAYNKTLIAKATVVASGGLAKIIVLHGDLQGYIQTGDGILKTLFDANTILKADADNTPEVLTVAEQRLVGRITAGEITGLTAAQVKTLLGAGAASGLATLNASSKVVEDPATAFFKGDGSQSLENLLSNGDFEVGDPPTGWSAGYSATLAQEGGAGLHPIGTYSIKVTVADGQTNAWASQDLADPTRYQGRAVTIGAWIYVPSTISAGAVVRIALRDDRGNFSSASVPHDDAWHWVTRTVTVDAVVTYVGGSVGYIAAGDPGDYAYADGAILVEGDSIPAFSPAPLREDGQTELMGNLSVAAGVTIDGIDISAHDVATTGVHGVGANTIEHTGNKGAASGYLGLDASGYIPAVTLGGAVTVNGQLLDCGTGQVEIRTTGADQGLLVTSTQDSSGAASFVGYVNSASPAADDNLCSLTSYGKDSVGNLQQYGAFLHKIEDPTSTVEDGTFETWLTFAGAWHQALRLTSAGALEVDASSGLGAATVGEFDKYDDAWLLRQVFTHKNMERLIDIGVAEYKTTGSGYSLKLQPWNALLAGAIYQTRALVEALAQRVGISPHNLIAETLALGGQYDSGNQLP